MRRDARYAAVIYGKDDANAKKSVLFFRCSAQAESAAMRYRFYS